MQALQTGVLSLPIAVSAVGGSAGMPSSPAAWLCLNPDTELRPRTINAQIGRKPVRSKPRGEKAMLNVSMNQLSGSGAQIL